MPVVRCDRRSGATLASVSEKRIKPVEAADRLAEEHADAAALAARAWWRRVPSLLTHPADVFVALRATDQQDVDARSEPLLAIMLLAGMAGIILTPAWGTLLDDESLDWIVLAVITFIGGLFYGVAGYFLLGLAVWLGARGVGVDTAYRTARQVIGFAALPLALSLGVTLPMIVVAFGSDWFRTGGSDDGAGRVVVLAIGLAFVRWSLVLLAVGLRATFGLPVARRRRRARARRRSIVAGFAVLPSVL